MTTAEQNQIINKQMSTLADLAQKSEQRQYSFLQHIVLVTSSTLGIVVSLHGNASQFLCSRWVFVLAVIVMCMGCLCSSVALYNQSQLLRLGQKKYSEECIIALREERKAGPVTLQKTKLHTICEKITYISVPLSYILLGTYAILSAFSY